MKTIEIAWAEGNALDWLVATKVMGLTPTIVRHPQMPYLLQLKDAQGDGKVVEGLWQPSLDVTQGYPILELLNVSTLHNPHASPRHQWEAFTGRFFAPRASCVGPTRMVAGLRAAVMEASKSNEAEVPDELARGET